MNQPSTESPANIVTIAAEQLATLLQPPNTFDLDIHKYTMSGNAQSYVYKQTTFDVIKQALKALFETSQSNDAFYAYARSLLSVAHRMSGGLSSVEYDLEIDARHTVIDVFRVGDDSGIMSITYDKPLTRPRTSWHDFFMEQAFKAAARSTCASGRRVGAVFVRNKAALVTAYNGVPSGYPHPQVCPRIAAGCKSGEGLDMCPCNHAEMNGLAMASREGTVLAGSTLYCTSRPCAGCMGILANIGLAAIVYKDDYPHPVSEKIAEHAKLHVYHITEARRFEAP